MAFSDFLGCGFLLPWSLSVGFRDLAYCSLCGSAPVAAARAAAGANIFKLYFISGNTIDYLIKYLEYFLRTTVNRVGAVGRSRVQYRALARGDYAITQSTFFHITSVQSSWIV